MSLECHTPDFRSLGPLFPIKPNEAHRGPRQASGHRRYVMTGDAQTIEQIVAQTQRLSPDDRVRLIQRVLETLIPTIPVPQQQRLQYGKYKGGRMSTEE